MWFKTVFEVTFDFLYFYFAFYKQVFSSILGQGIFGTTLARNMLGPENFGTWIFWHLAKQYGRFGTDISAPVLLCRNVHVPKSPRAEMFLCQKFLGPKSPCAEKSPCRNVPVLKCPSAGTSAAPNGARAEMFP